MFLMGDILKRNARLSGKKIGLVDGNRRFAYGEINRRANCLSNALIDLGLKKGDKVAFMGNNCHQFVEAYFAVAKSGFVIVPINARLCPEEAVHIINHSDSVVLIYHDELEDKVGKMREKMPDISYMVSTGLGGNNEFGYERLLMRVSGEEPKEINGPDDVVMIMYTSGATGPPKGVINSQRNIMANTITMTLELRIVPEDITLLVMPLYHNGGFWPVMTHFYRGATVILSSHFDATEVLTTIETERATLLNLVPTMLMRIISHPKLSDTDLDSLRLIMYAGAPIAVVHIKTAMKALGPHRFYTGLGCTEACGMILSFPANEHELEGPLAKKIASVGRDGIGIEAIIVDDHGDELPPWETGEIIVRGENVASGYWRMPEETAETFRDGWLYTGDMGYRDEDGYVFLMDRKKDIIISGGENISSREVEEVILKHPGVKEVAVIGLPDEVWGEAVKAVISLKPGYEGSITEKEIIEFSRSRLASYKKPRSVDFVTALPKTALGKIAKGQLKRFYQQGRVGVKAPGY